MPPAKPLVSMLPALVACLLLAVALPGNGLAAEPSDYRGTYQLADPAGAEAARDEAVEALAVQVPGLFRSLLRNRLATAATVTRFFSFESGGDRMMITSDRSPRGWSTGLGAPEVEVTSDDGQRFHLSRWFEGGTLNSRGRSRKGERQSRFELSPDGGQLAVTTTITNIFLPAPLVYRTDYQRQVEPSASDPVPAASEGASPGSDGAPSAPDPSASP